MKKIIFTFLLLAIFSSSSIAAKVAECTISIDDNSGSTYTIKHKFFYKKEGRQQSKHFAVPGHDDYSCTLAFWELKNGTMLSCEYKKDMGHTFFQSDRSTLKDENTDNHLSFRHKKLQLYLKTSCK